MRLRLSRIAGGIEKIYEEEDDEEKKTRINMHRMMMFKCLKNNFFLLLLALKTCKEFLFLFKIKINHFEIHFIRCDIFLWLEMRRKKKKHLKLMDLAESLILIIFIFAKPFSAKIT